MSIRLLKMGGGALALALAACGGGGGGDSDEAPAPRSDVSVALTAPERVTAGTTLTYELAIANAGPDAAEAFAATLAIEPAQTGVTVTCSASGGATCPSAPGLAMTIPTLPAGGSLSMSVSFGVDSTARGPIELTAQVAPVEDSVATNNSQALAVIAQDARNGEYRLYAANAYEYVLAIDFDANTYAVTGNGFEKSGNFTFDASSSTYTIDGNERLRVAEDLVVGGLNFGSGVIPFVAARNFITDPSQAYGEYNSLGINVSSTGVLRSIIGATRLSAAGLEVCADFVVYSMTACPAESVKVYTLTLNGDEFLAEAGPNDSSIFRLARSGDTVITLRASYATATNDRRFRVSLPNTAPVAGSSAGANSLGEWSVVDLTGNRYDYSATDGLGHTTIDGLELSGVGALGPAGLRAGTRDSDGAFFFLTQAGPLTVKVGAAGGTVNGLVEISVR